MAPAQSLMGIETDNTPLYSTITATEKDSFSANTNGYGTSNMTSCDGTVNGITNILGEGSKIAKDAENVEVDIIECTSDSISRLKEAEDPDATECSSSFADTTSDTEKCSGLSEAEVESHFFGDSALGSSYDAFSGLFQMRKKKLTTQWRNFIRPLMWRCKWTELRLKEIESQALTYARELAAYDQRELFEIAPSVPNRFSSKSLPYSAHCSRRRALKRMKRKRVEDTTDITSYMSHHNLFSYLETKRSNSDGTVLADDFGGSVMVDQRADCKDKDDSDDDQALCEYKDGHNTLEQVLWKIEVVHSQVHKLKSRVDAVMSQHVAKFSSSENLSLLAPFEGQASSAQTSSAPSPTFSACNGDAMSMAAMYNSANHISDYDIGNLMLPESAISSYGEAFHVPDIIESTVGLLSAADVTFNQPQIGDSGEDMLDNVLIDDEAAEEVDKQVFMNTSYDHQPTDKRVETEKVEEGESSNPPQLPSSVVPDTSVPQDQSTIESCLSSDIPVARNKRKRGERKAGSCNWSKQQPNEPDSQ